MEPLPDQDLLEFAFRNNRSQTRREPCPSAAEICAAVEGRVSRSEILKIIDHCAICGHCAEDWRIARLVVDEVPSSAPALRVVGSPDSWTGPRTNSRDTLRPPRARAERGEADADRSGLGAPPSGGRLLNRTRSGARASILTAVAACVVLGWSLSPKKQGEGTGQAVYRGEQASPTKLHYDERASRFIWQSATQEASFCRVEISDENLNSIASLESKITGEVSITPELANQLRKVPRFYWQVRCKTGEGSKTWTFSKTLMHEGR